MQIMQNLSTPLHKVNDVGLYPRCLHHGIQTATLSILCYQVVFLVVELEHIDYLEDVVPLEFTFEPFYYGQLPVPVILRLPFLGLFELLYHNLVVYVFLLGVGLVALALFGGFFNLPDSSIDNSEASPAQKVISVDLVICPAVVDGQFGVGSPFIL